MFSKYLTPLFSLRQKKGGGACSSKKLVGESWFSWLQATESDPLLEGYQRQRLKTWEMSRNQENQLLGTTEKMTKATYVPATGHIVITSICDLSMSQYCVAAFIPRLPAPITQESEFLGKNEVGQVQDTCGPPHCQRWNLTLSQWGHPWGNHQCWTTKRWRGSH